MEKTRKIIVGIIVLLLVLSLGCIYASSFNFTLSSDKTTLKPGDTVKISLNISNIDVGQSGINTIEAVLDYDEDVFEQVIPTNFAGLNNWSITYNNEEGENKGKFVAVIVQEGVTSNQSIGTLTLKVKEGIEDVSTKVTFRDIKTNDGTDEVTVQNQTVTLNIQNPVIEEPIQEPDQPSNEEDNRPTNEADENGNQNQNNNQNPNTNNQQKPVNQQENLSPGILPQTGETAYIAIGISIIIILVAIIAYKRFKNMKDIK